MSTRSSILIFCPFFRPNVGGVETHLTDLTEYLRKNGYRVFVVTYQPLTTKVRAPRTEKQENLEIHRIDWFGQNLFNKLAQHLPLNFAYLFPGLLLYGLFFLLKREREVDVLHGHGLASAVVIASLAGLFRKRSVLSLHTNYRFKENAAFTSILKPILSRMDHILVCANDIKNDLIAIGITQERISVFRYWVNQSIFKPMDKISCKKMLNLEGKFVALFVGRFIESKGVKVVLKTAFMMNDDINFLFVGSGPLEYEIRSAASKLHNVILIGKVDNENLPSYYNAADVLTWGTVDYDYLNRVDIEAISCGLPIIVPNRIEIFNISKSVAPSALDPSIGVLIDPSSQTLHEQLQFFMRHPQQLRSLASNCRKYAIENYSEKNAKVIEDAYKAG